MNDHEGGIGGVFMPALLIVYSMENYSRLFCTRNFNRYEKYIFPYMSVDEFACQRGRKCANVEHFISMPYHNCSETLWILYLRSYMYTACQCGGHEQCDRHALWQSWKHLKSQWKYIYHSTAATFCFHLLKCNGAAQFFILIWHLTKKKTLDFLQHHWSMCDVVIGTYYTHLRSTKQFGLIDLLEYGAMFVQQSELLVGKVTFICIT